MKVSPFAPPDPPALAGIDGVRMASAEAGIRYRGRRDLLLMLFDEGTTVGGVLTRSKTASAPVDWCRERLITGRARALVVNSGNANAFTGMRGVDTVTRTADIAARAADCATDEVLIASTGVIGEPLEVERFAQSLTGLAAQTRSDGWLEAAQAIMTTDTYPKLATRRAIIGSAEVTINGIAKGSGMIAPDMGTMLCFLATDAPIAAPVLNALCRQHADSTFNAITVDGDTSTSDTLLMFATGAALRRGAARIEQIDDPELAAFSLALHALMFDLAMQVVKDGEGLSKFVTIRVEGAEDNRAARRIAFSIANSPLVKTALAGEDPNWGRIVMAVGKAGEAACRDRLAIWFGDMPVAQAGMVHPDYREADGAAYMRHAELLLRVDVGTGGPGTATVWTTDLSATYVAINSDYRS